ncbi:hypothetical protein KUL25_09705 [Rhodobacteraceae bacterium N5(2021)]|uniref:Uncharacterized protein n=1 Tax=Gymnodinialimonas phycosphaerae TaxID=2841589 RepID=A0A975YHU3_9RHOB|nr:hypothetical protein [Gymnodinialimonas phycosphaerae]MBY4893038.1 hypothetical protein [Gymnodinialimonas phycosphaerae]
MSDPAKTPEEIEDVLASVRRLVSDHAPIHDGATHPSASEPSQAEAPEQQVEALILSPSFRVTDPEDPWVPVATSSEPDSDSTAAQTPDAEDLIAEIVTAEVDAPVQELDAVPPQEVEPEWQPDDRLAHFDAVGGSTQEGPAAQEWIDDHSDEPAEEDLADLIRLDGADASVADFESETGDDNWPEGGAEAALLTLVARRDPAPETGADATVEDPAEEDEAEDVAPQEASGEDDAGAPDTAMVEELVERQAKEGTVEDAPSGADAVLDDPAEAPIDEDLGAEDQTADAPDAEAQAEALGLEDPEKEERAQSTPIFSRASRSVEQPTEQPAESTAGQTAEQTAEPTSEQTVEDLGDTPSPFSFPETDDGILDEDTLREIIVDVVREELQGVLGQRITRNVRKMVRREIRLALAAEDLE